MLTQQLIAFHNSTLSKWNINNATFVGLVLWVLCSWCPSIPEVHCRHCKISANIMISCRWKMQVEPILKMSHLLNICQTVSNIIKVYLYRIISNKVVNIYWVRCSFIMQLKHHYFQPFSKGVVVHNMIMYCSHQMCWALPHGILAELLWLPG